MTDAFAGDAAAAKPNLRAQSWAATRKRLLDAAVESLIEGGAARTTTVAVQMRAGVSRGALLHHFPSQAELLSATVDELVRRNEAAVRDARARQRHDEPVERAVQTLATMMAQPAFLAELELWAVARTDAALREALLAAERSAEREKDRVVGELFAPVADRPGYAGVVAMTVEFLRGLALSGVLRRNPSRRRRLIAQWIWAARILLDHRP